MKVDKRQKREGNQEITMAGTASLFRVTHAAGAVDRYHANALRPASTRKKETGRSHLYNVLKINITLTLRHFNMANKAFHLLFLVVGLILLSQASETLAGMCGRIKPVILIA